MICIREAYQPQDGGGNPYDGYKWGYGAPKKLPKKLHGLSLFLFTPMTWTCM